MSAASARAYEWNSLNEIAHGPSALLLELDVLSGGPGHPDVLPSTWSRVPAAPLREAQAPAPFPSCLCRALRPSFRARRTIPVSRRIAHGDSGPRPRDLSRPSLDPHRFRERPRKAIARFGEGPWKGIYSALSAIGFVLIVWGFARARFDAPAALDAAARARHITMLLMLVALILLASYLFKRSHITAAVHHPMLWSVLLWSAGHLIANGSAADLVLFGGFLVWSAADLASSYARDRRNGVVYPAPSCAPRPALSSSAWSCTRCLIGCLHLWLFGVSPLAG